MPTARAWDSSGGPCVPVVVLSLIAGVMVDRYPPRRTLVTASVAQGAALAVLAAFQAADGLNFGQLVVVAAVIGVATVFYEVAYQSTLPRLLPLNSIAAANGLPRRRIGQHPRRSGRGRLPRRPVGGVADPDRGRRVLRRRCRRERSAAAGRQGPRTASVSRH